MPIMVQAKSGVRPKSPTSEKPAKKAASKRAPKSVREVDDRLRRLGPYPVVTGPYDAEDYDALTRRRLDWTAQRRLLLALRHELGKKTDNDAIAVKATVEVAVDDPESKRKARKNLTRVRQSEAWRYNQLTGIQRQAEVEMELVWKARTTGLGTSAARYGQSYRLGQPAQDISASIDRTWRDWIDMSKIRGVDVNVVISCLSEPMTLTDIERERRMQPGDALSHYQRGLDLWAELRGWIVRQGTIA